MSLLTVPTRSDLANYSFPIDFEDSTYTLEFNFNFRWNKWVMRVYDNEEDLIATGIPMQTDANLTARFVMDGMFTGFVYLLDTAGGTTDMENKEDFGGRFLLLYQESE